jgi:hypothetical protein
VTVRLGDDVLSLLEDIELLFSESAVTSPDPLYPPELYFPDGATAEQLVTMRDRFRNSKEGAAIRGFLCDLHEIPKDEFFFLLYKMEVVSFHVEQVVVELTAPTIAYNAPRVR